VKSLLNINFFLLKIKFVNVIYSITTKFHIVNYLIQQANYYKNLLTILVLAMPYLFFAFLKDYFANLKITFFSNSKYFIFKL